MQKGQIVPISKTTRKRLENETKKRAEKERTIPIYVPKSVLTNYQSAEVWLEFNLIGEEKIATAMEETTANDHLQNVKKLLRNGQVLILRNGKIFDMMG